MTIERAVKNGHENLTTLERCCNCTVSSDEAWSPFA